MKKRTLAFLCGMGLAGGVVFAGGCGFGFGGWNWQRILWDVATNVGTEFVLDNDGIFDLFQDDFGTGTTYDDRGLADASREEPTAD